MGPSRRSALLAPALLVVLLLVGSLATGCSFRLVRGSGELTTLTPEVGAFRAIDAANAFQVEVGLGEPVAVTVEVDDNIVDDVIVEVRDEVLHLSVRSGLTLTNVTLRATVMAPALDELHASGAARIEVGDLIATDLLRTTASGASTVAATLEVQELDTKASGASTLELTGTADAAVLDADGASTIDAAGLTAGDAEVVLSGASDAEVAVTGVLDARLSGSSTLHYLGEPATINESVSGASRLRSS
jgi:hypothetical protein